MAATSHLGFFVALSFVSLCTSAQWSYFSHGSGPNELIVWQPYAAGVNGGSFAHFFLQVANRFVTATQVDGKDTFTVRVVNADWSGAASEPMCASGQPRTKCPDVVMLGTTQLAWRVENGDLRPLNAYFANFSATLGHQFQDDFLRVRPPLFIHAHAHTHDAVHAEASLFKLLITHLSARTQAHSGEIAPVT